MLTLRTGVVQVRRFGDACRVVFVRRGSGQGGVADAVPGVHDGARRVDRHRQHRRRGHGDRLGRTGRAVLDLGYGFVATAIKFAEAVLGVHVPRGHAGDDVPVRPDVLPARRPEVAGARAGSSRSSPRVAALTTTPFTQPNSIALVVNSVFGDARMDRVGIVIAVLTWLVIIGGIKSIGRAAEKLSPLKVGLYLARRRSIVILHLRGAAARRASRWSFREALRRCGRRWAFGMFMAMRYGIARGIYANEAGYGTAAVAYGTAQSDAARRSRG